MINLYNVNGLMFWNKEEIALREHFCQTFARELESILKSTNRAWEFVEIEAPLLTPSDLLNANYTTADVWAQGGDEQLTLRPETTPGSYRYAEHLLNNQTSVRTPFCVWQSGKSFRREQDQVTKNMRLKEFYQQEFQCLYTSDSKNDYHAAILQPMCDVVAKYVGLPARVVDSDRLPDYSLKTSDIEVDNGDKWMEVSSISLRKDFATPAKFANGQKSILVLEVAIGLDRCVYNFLNKK